jgi:LmbE family N-acetylglucosaminyl deacetylase
MEDKKNILVVAAHPDDEVLGCGGTIARLAHEGHNVSIAILGEGITSRNESGGLSIDKQLTVLKQQSGEAARILGVDKVCHYSLPDNAMDTIPMLTVVKIIEDLIAEIKPNTIFTHHSGDLNIDHSITLRAVLTASRPVNHCTVKHIYSFEIPSSTEWSCGKISGNYHPNTFVDIESYVEKKIEAMEIYCDEVRSSPHPRSRDVIVATSCKYGSYAGVSAAEPFELIRGIV